MKARGYTGQSHGSRSQVFSKTQGHRGVTPGSQASHVSSGVVHLQAEGSRAHSQTRNDDNTGLRYKYSRAGTGNFAGTDSGQLYGLDPPLDDMGYARK